jgi:hypothetical protein
MKDYRHLFPAGFFRGQFRVATMTSFSYGREDGDPQSNMVVVEEGQADHQSIHQWLRGCGTTVLVRMIGTKEQGPVGNKPTDLALFFGDAEVQQRFIEHFGLGPGLSDDAADDFVDAERMKELWSGKEP